MFHLLVSYSGWADDNGSMSLGRCFEYTSDDLEAMFKPDNQIDLQKIKEIPALFVTETGGDGPQQARAGRITNARINGREIVIDYLFDSSVPQVTNSKLQELQRELGIDSFELTRTHWAIKAADLFKTLLKNHIANLPAPKVFRLDTVDGVDNTLVSAMMPFAREFDGVHAALVSAATSRDMQCLRADDIWEDDAVIQDIVSLINRSRIVICDCTGRNSNVFYEAGIAHCLGKDVLLISQNEADVPFDLRHLRYVHYHDNAEGRTRLTAQVAARIETILNR